MDSQETKIPCGPKFVPVVLQLQQHPGRIGSFNSGSGSDPGLGPKRKRGRPRKLSESPASSAAGAAADSSENQAKKSRGRPPSSANKQMGALDGIAEVDSTIHSIDVKPGEDIAHKIMMFTQQGTRTVWILSAFGSICNATLCQPSASGGTLTLEGRFEILSLNGLFSPSESDGNGNRSRMGRVTVTLTSANGDVVGGCVSGMLMAASSVKVIAVSCTPKTPKRRPSPPLPPRPNILNFGSPIAKSSSHPSEADSCGLGDENGGNPPPPPEDHGGSAGVQPYGVA